MPRYENSLQALLCDRYSAQLLSICLLRLIVCSQIDVSCRITTTAASYESFTTSRGIETKTVKWGETGEGHWVGNQDASNVLVWFHGRLNPHYYGSSLFEIASKNLPGGNYYAPAHPAYFEFLQNMVDALRLSNVDFAIFVPSYSLAPHAQYPTQLLEGLQVLQFLIEEEGKLAKNIAIGGDSAGGNLVLGILSHIAHPHPGISEGFIPDEPFAGALIHCPWVTFDQTWPSIERNKHKDSVPLLPNSVHAKYFLGDAPSDNYNEPLSAPPEWWAGLNARMLLLLSGEDDIMVDSHHAFGKILVVCVLTLSLFKITAIQDQAY